MDSSNINYTERDPFDVLIPAQDLSTTGKRRLNVRSPRTKWINCLVFAYPEYNRIVVLLQKVRQGEGLAGVGKVFKFIVGSDLSVITDTLNYKGMSNVLFLVGLFSEDNPHIFGKELVMSFQSKEDRMLFIHEYEGKLRFTNYLGTKTRHSSRPNPEHCKALGRYLATIQNYQRQRKLAVAYVLQELEKGRLSESQSQSQVEGSAATSELRRSNVQDLLLNAKSEAATDRDYLGPYYVDIEREPLRGTMLDVANTAVAAGIGGVSRKPWLQCVLYGFVQTNRVTLYHSTRRKPRAVEDGFESGILWTLTLTKELVDVQVVEPSEEEEEMPNQLRLKNVIYAHGDATQLQEIVISFPLSQNRQDFIENFPILATCLATETTELVDSTRLLAQYTARLEEEKEVGAVLGNYLKASVNHRRLEPEEEEEETRVVGMQEEERHDDDAASFGSSEARRTAFVRRGTDASDETSEIGFNHRAPRGYGSRVKSFLYSLFNSEHTKLEGNAEDREPTEETDDDRRLTHQNTMEEKEEEAEETEEKEETPEPPPKFRRRSLSRTDSQRKTREFIVSQAMRAAQIAEKTNSFITGSTESVGEESLGSSDEEGESEGEGERIVVGKGQKKTKPKAKPRKRPTAISRPQSSVSQPYTSVSKQRSSVSQLTTFEGPFEVHTAKDLAAVTVDRSIVAPVRGKAKSRKNTTPWEPCDVYFYPKPRVILVVYVKKKKRTYMRSLSWNTESTAQFRCTPAFNYVQHVMQNGQHAMELHGLESMQKGARESGLMLYLWDPTTHKAISGMLDAWQATTSQTDSLRESVSSERESRPSSAQLMRKTLIAEDEDERGPYNAKVKASAFSRAEGEASTVERWIHCSINVDGQAQAITADLLETVPGVSAKRVTFYRGSNAPSYIRLSDKEQKLVEITGLVMNSAHVDVCISFDSAEDEEDFSQKLDGWAKRKEAHTHERMLDREVTLDSKATFQLVHRDDHKDTVEPMLALTDDETESEEDDEGKGGDEEDEEEEKLGEGEQAEEDEKKNAEVKESGYDEKRRDSDSYFCRECDEVYDLHECEITFMLEDRALSGGRITCPMNHTGTEW